MIHGQLSFGAFFKTIWRFCVLYWIHTNENGSMFLILFHPSTACLRVMWHVWFNRRLSFCLLLFSTIWELETRFVCLHIIYRLIFWRPYSPVTQISRLFFFFNSSQAKHAFEIVLSHNYCLSSFINSLPRNIYSSKSLPLSLMKKV